MSAKVLILAAGEGTRMKSSRPKVAHELLGKPLVRWVVDAAYAAQCDEVITVVGHGREAIIPLLSKDSVIVVQEEQLGTGHAVMCAREVLAGSDGSLVVLSGDSPLIRPSTIEALIASREERDAAVALLTMRPPCTTGYGRIVRDDKGVAAIVEEKDCSSEQREIEECNSGIYCFDIPLLLSHLDTLSTSNAQKEYYLTDLIRIYREEGLEVVGTCCGDYTEALGINSRMQLAEASMLMQQRINGRHMVNGVTMLDPTLVWIGPDVAIERDVELLPMTFLMGRSTIGEGSVIGPNSRLTDTVVGKNCKVDETVSLKVVLDDHVTCGPRAYLRPGTHMCESSKAGTHVEIKNSLIGPGSKVPHLSYIGDATLGNNVNIGAGSITCNYDGVNKYKTTIGDDAFIGSDTMMVAPVNIGAKATTGAGSTITK
ncbi:MAG: bifunctional UDP-N-acetylglucosamine diphosphorylase/glucosamine-1-phosphate N-acetyltransferase GlmU, partial [Actinobacteria bacterium]|nr:bifunctional UDP-N-acetylglucosamine diphosphorylase/glucosamine-1-phosphate N-acetyltransferase GlmU [Actinomycetota bacterium]